MAMDVLNLTICIMNHFRLRDFEASYFVCCFSYCITPPALSTLAIPCRLVHSCIFHTPIFDRAVLSTPANSINPYKCRHGMAPSVDILHANLITRRSVCHLRSGKSGHLSVPRTITNYSNRRFAVRDPGVQETAYQLKINKTMNKTVLRLR